MNVSMRKRDEIRLVSRNQSELRLVRRERRERGREEREERGERRERGEREGGGESYKDLGGYIYSRVRLDAQKPKKKISRSMDSN